MLEKRDTFDYAEEGRKKREKPTILPVSAARYPFQLGAFNHSLIRSFAHSFILID
jgi:hypothetical protein